ncbi:nucleotide-binding universal stress UspA family protein [Streptosporangium becharense]|uniref:Nucleotide-binding universal stress UspA family protein n=1 Tax=Streptosporangium becharense TaxID=1816182 RepID=A0A7W9IAB7_9ACTN|nr:universal stress protein [Streptosporangium becharense]MBB2915612.1 nucleotide-binding universal stress UspA family protein [Streptosporangium becharense]MBB5817053.1 nucleotide-binding universal stress UspA family protein [Streptosporangium becharense]
MTAHVTVGADGSPSSQAAVEWAADDAVRRGCALRIVHACPPWIYEMPLHTPPGFRDSMTDHCQRLLEAAADLARAHFPQLKVETVLGQGKPVDILRREAEDAEHLVLGGRGLGGFAGLLLGSVSLALAGHVTAPVVVVKKTRHQTHDEVVVGFDGSSGSTAAFAYAFEEAVLRKARLHAIHAVQASVLGPYAAAYTSLIDDTLAVEKRLAAETLVPWRERYPQVEIKETVVIGHPVAVLREASEAADLVVVGSRGMGGLGSAVLGSVSHGVLHHAHCPVAVVRPKGEV